jgi:hypothetical protein
MKDIPIVTAEDLGKGKFLLKFADGEELLVNWILLNMARTPIQEIALILRVSITEAVKYRDIALDAVSQVINKSGEKGH